MYFTSNKSKWYSRAVHTKPLYRYSLLIFLAGFFFIGWHYTVFSLLDTMIMQDQAALRALHMQMIQFSHAQKVCDNLSCSLPAMQKQVVQLSEKCCTTDYYQKQVHTIIDESHKAGLSLVLYGDSKQLERDWCTCNEAKFSFVGNLDGILQFFNLLEKKGSMIRCTSFSCEKSEAENYTSSCTFEFISVS